MTTIIIVNFIKMAAKKINKLSYEIVIFFLLWFSE